MILKEDIKDFLESEIWKELQQYMIDEREEAHNDLAQLNFSDTESNLMAVKYQAKIEIMDMIIDKILTMEETEDSK
jgi:hypothetical protein